MRSTLKVSPGDIVFGLFPTHDRGDQWHPALVVEVDDRPDGQVFRAVLGSSRRVSLDGHAAAEFVIMDDDAGFTQTGLHKPTRFNLNGLLFSVRPGMKFKRIGTITSDLGLVLRLRRAYLHATGGRE